MALLAQRRAVEAYLLIEPMLRSFRRLTAYAHPQLGAGLMVRDVLDLDASMVAIAAGEGFDRTDRRERIMELAAQAGITVPDVWSQPDNLPFDDDLIALADFAGSMTATGLATAQMHLKRDVQGEFMGFHTVELGDGLIDEQLNNAVELLLRSAECAASILGWPYDQEAGRQLSADVEPPLRRATPNR